MRYPVVFLLFALLFMLCSQADTLSTLAKRGKNKAKACHACHCQSGISQSPTLGPNLAGQNRYYLVQSLQEYKKAQSPEQGRYDPIMTPVVQALSQEDMLDIAVYYANQPPERFRAKPRLLQRGSTLYRWGDHHREISACQSCHMPQGEGLDSAAIPRLSGQHPEYLVAQLQAYRANKRKGILNIINDIAQRMTDEDMKAVAKFASALH